MHNSAIDRRLRRDAIVRLVRTSRVASQAELQSLLERQGFGVNQATLSRDLRDMRLRKGPDGYELPSDPPTATATNATPAAGAPALALWNAVREWLQSAVPSGQLFVLKTPPSGASPLAAALDQAGEPALLGTIAGDDTVLGICTSAVTARRLCRRLLAMRPADARPGRTVP